MSTKLDESKKMMKEIELLQKCCSPYLYGYLDSVLHEKLDRVCDLYIVTESSVCVTVSGLMDEVTCTFTDGC